MDVLINWGSGKYIELPGKWDINEYNIMNAFCGSIDNERINNVLYSAIKGHGAYRKFKDALCRYGVQDEWYKFRDEALKAIAMKWCDVNRIIYVVDKHG